jgi:hypothetical protein
MFMTDTSVVSADNFREDAAGSCWLEPKTGQALRRPESFIANNGLVGAVLQILISIELAECSRFF